MKKRKKTSSIKDLYKNKLLFTQTLSLIHKGISYRKIQKFLNDQKFSASLGLVERLVKKVKKSKQDHIPLSKLVDKRAFNKHKKTISDVEKAGRLKLSGEDPKIQSIINSSIKKAQAKVNKVSILPPNEFYNAREVLDLQINQYRDMVANDEINKVISSAGLKAIQLELKYSGDDSLSLQAIKQYELIVEAHMTAIAEVAEKDLPKPIYDKFMKDVSKSEKDIQDQTQITKNGKRLANALKGFDI